MAQKDLHTYFLNLASKYLSGNATDVEVRELEDWVQADAENKRTFQAFKKAWILTGTAKEEVQPDTDRLWEETSAQLFGDANVIRMKTRRRWISIAASIALLALIGAAIFLQPWSDQTMTASATDEAETIELKDGSQVILNQTATLSYAYDQKTQARRVELTGDAFFDVAHDESKPFIIQAGALEIEVLGTSFYVDARRGLSEMQVIVESGRVAVRHEAQETILETDEMAVFQIDTRQLSKQEVQNENFRALKTKTLAFDNTPLSRVVFDLNRYYHANIRIGSQALNDCQLDATFTDKSLEAVLKILESSFDLSVTHSGERIVLSGDCANSN